MSKVASKAKAYRSVRAGVVARDGAGAVIGRADLEADTQGNVWVWLVQTYGGSAEGTLSQPVKCDLDVLEAIVQAAREVDAFAPVVPA